ncbi:MAG: IS4 family transposase [bacterium]
MQKSMDEYPKYKEGMHIGILSDLIPTKIIEEYKTENNITSRNRIYGCNEVIFGQLMQACLEDKSEQNIVKLLSEYQNENIKKLSEIEKKKKEEYENYTGPKRTGRPRIKHIDVPKSKLKPISLNTASYDEAKKRVKVELFEKIFRHTTTEEFLGQKNTQKWYGREVMVVDGTTFMTVDTPELRKYFTPNLTKENATPLPTGRIEGLLDLYSGHIVDFRISDYATGEIKLIKSMYESIPKSTVLLGDDLYCSYGHFAYCQINGTDLITQGKKNRIEKVVKRISKNDCIIEWKCSCDSVWLGEKKAHPETILVRKITIKLKDKNTEEMHLYTTLLDYKKYKAKAISDLYFYRWEIELSFKEIKSVMQMTYTRGKTVESVKKEIISHFIVYNIIRKMIHEVFQANGEDIFSLRTSIQECTIPNKVDGGYVDILGRRYAKKSTGRYPVKNI